MKKGFTLIELLAVIVILSIVALIATPIIFNAIEESQIKAFEVSIRHIVKATELYKSQYELANDKKLVDTTINITNNKIEGDVLKVNGELPDNGVIKIDQKGRISVDLNKGKLCGKKSFMSETVEIYKEDCELENLWFTEKKYPITQDGVTIDYDHDTQTYTLNGTSNVETFMFQPISTRVFHDFNIGDKYVVKIFYISGNVKDLTHNIAKSDLFQPNGSYFSPGKQVHAVSSSPILSNLKGSVYTIDSSAAEATSFRHWIGAWNSTITYENYKVRIYCGKDGKLDKYIMNIRDI